MSYPTARELGAWYDSQSETIQAHIVAITSELVLMGMPIEVAAMSTYYIVSNQIRNKEIADLNKMFGKEPN